MSLFENITQHIGDKRRVDVWNESTFVPQVDPTSNIAKPDFSMRYEVWWKATIKVLTHVHSPEDPHEMAVTKNKVIRMIQSDIYNTQIGLAQRALNQVEFGTKEEVRDSLLMLLKSMEQLP